jgi:hypothetical protein
MSWSAYFFTGVIESGGRFIARWHGEYVGAYDTWAEANTALKQARRG